jgi:prevent-host-death family protein
MVECRETMSLSLKVLKERAVGIRDFQANPTKVLERVVGSREPLLVTRRNLPIAALIDVEELERLLEAEARLELLEKGQFQPAPLHDQ